MIVNITGKQYKLCDKTSHNYWANKKKGNYGKGQLNSENDTRKTERTGLLGEMAFSIITGLDVDFSYKEYGDNYDFITKKGTKIDVKTSHEEYNNMWIYYKKNGKLIDWKKEKDYFIQALIIDDNYQLEEAKIKFIGCISSNKINKYKERWIRPSPRFNSNWINIEVPYTWLHSFSAFQKLIKRGLI